MTNYFYTDASGQKQGPIDDQQLQALAAQGTIMPHTPMETDTGHKDVAGQIPGLKFTALESPSTPSEASSSKTSWWAIKQNVMAFLRWAQPILKKGGEMSVDTVRKAAPYVKAQSVNGFNTYFTIFWICVVAGMPLSFYGIPNIPMMSTAFVSMLLYMCWNLMPVAFGSMLLYQCWQLIPVDIARTTPGRAVGYCFIPLFNLYWFFVAFYGLSKDMNKALQRSGVAYRVNEGFGLAYCILAVTMCASMSIVVRSFIFDIPYGTITMTAPHVFFTAGIAFLIVGIFFLKSVKNGAVALLEPERANQMQSKKDAVLALARIIPVIMGVFVICFGGYDLVVTSGELSNFSYYSSHSSYVPGIHTMPRTSGFMPGMALMKEKSGNVYTRGGNNELIESDKSSYMYGFASFLEGFSEEHGKYRPSIWDYRSSN